MTIKDQNRVPATICASSSDGKTIITVAVNPVTNHLKTADGVDGIDYGPTNALHNPDGIPVLMGVSSVDGVTPVAIYADSNGNLLTQSS